METYRISDMTTDRRVTFEEKLIRLVKKDVSLYMPSKGQANLLKRNSKWNAIGKELNRTGEDCKQRWRSLRDRYVREKRKMDCSETECTEIDKWCLYDSLYFLNPSIRPRGKYKTLNNMYNIEIDNSLDDIEESSSTQDTSSPMEEALLKFVNDISATITAEPTPEPVSYNQKFMSIMALRMEPLSEAAKIRVHTIILNTIHEELLKKLTS